MPSYNKGFTLVELLVTIAIFTLMTGFIAVKYGNFSKSMVINNLAYDIALTLREAQSYGVSVADVKSLSDTTTTSRFDRSYGVHFDTATPKVFTLFVDSLGGAGNVGDGKFQALEAIRTFTISGNNTVYALCHDAACVINVGTAGALAGTYADVMFKRPNPNPVITSGVYPAAGAVNYLEIRIKNSDDSIRKKIVIRSSGQISIEEV